MIELSVLDAKDGLVTSMLAHSEPLPQITLANRLFTVGAVGARGRGVFYFVRHDVANW